MGFIAPRYWTSHPPTFDLDPDYHISYYFTILLLSELFIGHPLSHASLFMLHLPFEYTCPSHIFKNLLDDGFHSKLA